MTDEELKQLKEKALKAALERVKLAKRQVLIAACQAILAIGTFIVVTVHLYLTLLS